MRKEIAEEVSLLTLEMNGRLDDLLFKLQAECSEAEFHTLKLAFGQVMGRLYTDIAAPIYEQHPELLPVELGGPYAAPKHIYGRGK